MSKHDRQKRVTKLWGKRSPEEIAEELGVSKRTIQRDAKELGLSKYKPRTVHDKTKEVRKEQDIRRERKQSKEMVKRIIDLEGKLEAMTHVASYRADYKLPPPRGDTKTQAVAVAIASDWHIEEGVHGWETSQVNSFNEEICRNRVRRYFQHLVKLVKLHQENTTIETLVLALLGDFITNDIHDENSETARLLPMDAILECREHISTGIKYLLKNTDLKLLVPTASGNHARTTRRVHAATEHGHSLEFFMYSSLAHEFEDEPRVEIMLNKGYHTYVEVWENYTIRFHHGHAVRYGGGIGGLTIPMRKALAQWNILRRADLTVCGHFHQLMDGGDFIVNGSLIGYNAYALRIKASPEPPQQAFFLVDSSVGKIMVTPIILTEDR